MRRFLVVLLGVALLLGLSVIGFAPPERIKIGMLTSLTGALGPYGPSIRNGVQLAVDQLNEAGGLLGKEVELIVRDDGTSPDLGRDAASKLVEIDKVVAIIGALSSGVTLAASSVTIPAQIPLISPASTSPALTEVADNGYLFRTVVSDAMQGVVLAELAQELGYRAVNVLYVNNAYGKGLNLAFKRSFEALGGRVAAEVPYEENKPSYRSEVEAVMAGSPDAILFISYPVDGNKQITEAVEAGYQGKFLFPDGMKGEGVAPGPACPEGGSGPIEGAYGTAAGAPEVAIKAEFDADFAAKFGPTTIPYNAQAYDAAALIFLAAAKAGVASGPAIKDNLQGVANPPGEVVTYKEFGRALGLLAQGVEINYEGVSGPVDFDENGDMAKGVIEIWKIEGCKVVTVRMEEVGG